MYEANIATTHALNVKSVMFHQTSPNTYTSPKIVQLGCDIRTTMPTILIVI